jgi:translation initiation factor 1
VATLISKIVSLIKKNVFVFNPSFIHCPKNQSAKVTKINPEGLKLLYIAGANSLLSVMAEVCSTCGLPKDLCVCGEIEKEQQRIRIRLETRKFGKATTIIDGMDDKNSNLSSIAQKLKTYCACGGTSKNGQIMLQGDHRDRVREFLIKMGYPQENIELQ